MMRMTAGYAKSPVQTAILLSPGDKLVVAVVIVVGIVVFVVVVGVVVVVSD